LFHAILFDLDDTLLTTGLDTFLPAYFRAISASVSSLMDPRVFLQRMLEASRVMSAPHDAALTNQQVFEATFFPSLGAPRRELVPLLDRFYAEDFPKLRALTSPRPFAPAAVAAARTVAADVVIATQPVFPLTAIRQRLDWAGLATFPFRLVTCYENMHTCKPQRAYYDEIAAMLGRDAADCLMVGNDPSQDIAPAREARMATYLVTGNDAARPAGSSETEGSLQELVDRLSHWPPTRG
jgi:FMN phosphatase YigB (HAD superfamily)